MNNRHNKNCSRILLLKILCAALIIAFSGAVPLTADSLVANVPQFNDDVSSPPSNKPNQPNTHGLSDQAPLIDEKISVKNSKLPGSPQEQMDQTSPDPSQKYQVSSQAGSVQWDNQKIPRSKRAASNNTSSQAEKSPKYSGGLSIWRSMLSLVLVLLLIVGGSFLLRRIMPSANRFSKNSALEVLVRSPIGPKQSICLVKMGPRLVLIGMSPNHMAALDVDNDQQEIATILGRIETAVPESISNSFGQVFHQESGQFNDKSDELSNVQEKDDLTQVRQVHLARRELSGLLEKVKGLTRLRGRY